MQVSLERFSSIFLAPLLAIGWIASAACQTVVHEIQTQQVGVAMRDINDVKEAHVAELMAQPGVVGVYIGALDDGTPCIKVMVIKTTPELERKIPSALEGHPVLIVETGEIRPLLEKPLSA